jgi:DDE superfamily endonuclease
VRLEEIAHTKALDCDTIEIWFADEARIGQKNKITRRWAKRGTRPSAPRDQRTASTYIFGAVCPKEGNGAALIMPACNTEAMNLHLAEIAATVAPAAHAILLVSPTASSNPTTISSTTVVRHGTSSSTSLGASCPSDCANGPMGSDQWDLVQNQEIRLLQRLCLCVCFRRTHAKAAAGCMAGIEIDQALDVCVHDCPLC